MKKKHQTKGKQINYNVEMTMQRPSNYNMLEQLRIIYIEILNLKETNISNVSKVSVTKCL